MISPCPELIPYESGPTLHNVIQVGKPGHRGGDRDKRPGFTVTQSCKSQSRFRFGKVRRHNAGEGGDVSHDRGGFKFGVHDQNMTRATATVTLQSKTNFSSRSVPCAN